MKTNDFKMREIELQYKTNRNLAIFSLVYSMIVLFGIYLGVLPIMPQDPIVIVYAGPMFIVLVKLLGMNPKNLFGPNEPEQGVN